MKVGDLVCLSAAGMKIQQNRQFLEGFGMVVTDGKHCSSLFRCRWFHGDGRSDHRNFYRYEVKYKSKIK